jgi:parallel beta-helix repeat protein
LGIYLYQSNNNTILNSITNNNQDGIFLSSSNNNTILNSTASNNNQYGIYLYQSNNNTILNSTASNNSQYGIYLYQSNNNTILNSITNNNSDYGFLLFSASNYNTILNSTANSNYCGFYLLDSKNNTILNSNANNNQYGITIYYSSSNTIHSNRVQNNSQAGIYFSYMYNANNRIYNNLFNNTNNTKFDVVAFSNYWNTTKQTGTRVYSSGIYIGGNYWTNSTGNGYSDTCTDSDEDGFCDSNYTVNASYIDYLPLSDEFVDYPSWSLNSTSIVTTYSPTISQFNITWNDYGEGLNVTFFESNYTGSPKNETMVYLGSNVYSFNDTLPAGSFYWKSYANDTLGNSNSTPKWEFTVSKNSSVVAHLYFNGSDSDTSFNASQAINITGVLTGYSYGLTIHLDLNESGYGNNYQNGTNSVINYTKLSAGVYNVTAHFDGDQNYSSPSVTHYLTITENLPTYSHLKSSPTTPVTYTPNGIYYFNSTWLDADFITFEWNGTNNYTEITKSGNEYYINMTDLSASNYTYRWLANNTNSWTTTASYNYDVHDYPRWSSSSSSTPAQYNPSDSTFNITLTLNNTEISTSLLEINLSTPTNFTMSNSSKTSYYYQITLGAGSYRWKVYANNTQGFWNGTDYWEFTIPKNSTNPVHLSLSYSGNTYTDSNASTYSDVTINATPSATYDQSGTLNLFYDGNAVSYSHTTTHGVGTHIYKVNITENTNYTSNSTGLTFYLTISSQPSSGVPSGGGGGGGGGNITIIQNVTVNVTAEIRDFNFTVQTSEIQIYRGEDGTIVGAVSNTGNANLTLSSSIVLNSTCCVVSIVPSKFNLNIGGTEIPFTVSIHVNTSTEPEKEYFFDIKMKSETLEKSKRIKIIVKENPVISSLQQVSGQVSGIENKIREYKKVGLNIADLEGILNRIKETLSGSQSYINKDDINTLKTNENSVKLSLAQINDQLNKLAFVKTIYENKWNIISGITIGMISSYLIILVFVPYFKLGMEIRKLKFEEASLAKSRVETEKSYFLRKIDEKTFRTILSGKQGQIYKITAERKLKEQARSELLRERINPLYLGKLMREKMSKIKSKKQTNQL